MDTRLDLAKAFSTKAMVDKDVGERVRKARLVAVVSVFPGFSEVQVSVAWGQLVALSLGGEQVIVLSGSRQGTQDSPEDPHHSQSGKLEGANR